MYFLAMGDYQNRIVKGEIQVIGSNYLNLRLFDNKGRGRLPYENMIDPPAPGTFDKHFSIGQILTVFLEQQNNSDNLDWWRLNQRWVQDNPWGDLTVGEIVYGTVISYYKNIAAFVRLDNKNGLDSFLHISETIHGAVVIQDVLEVGDHIYAEIIEIDDERLHVSISIKSLLEQEKNNSNTPSYEHLLLEHIDSHPIFSPSLEDCHWLIIEDDHTLFGRFKNWSEGYNCTVTRASNLQHLEQILKRQTITHASVDANLDKFKNDVDSAAYLKLIKRHHKIRTVVISGDEQSKRLANQFSVPFIFKPVSESLLLNWLQNRKDDFHQSLKEQSEDWEDEAVHWQAEGLEFEIKKQATSELKRFAKKTNCIAALIALKIREGVIQIRTHYGLKNSDFEKKQHLLTHTLVNNIIETGMPVVRDQTSFGELMHILPLEAIHAYGFPVTINGEHERAVVFFRDKAFTDEEKTELMNIVPFLESLGEKLSLVQAWDEDRAFANLGRLSSAVMHELRNNISFLRTPIRKLKKIATESEVNIADLRSQIHSLEQRYSSVEQLLENNLNLIRQHRHGQFSLHDTLQRLVSFYQYEYQSEKNATLELEGPLYKIRLDFPVLAFEQSIINLLQNALYHIPKKTGHVTIRVLVTRPDQNGHSIFIDIADNGSGIPASMQDKLFKPRKTIKGSKGTGMGLYVSRNLLQAHGGDLVLADSVRYFGTCFRIALPREFGDAL